MPSTWDVEFPDPGPKPCPGSALLLALPPTPGRQGCSRACSSPARPGRGCQQTGTRTLARSASAFLGYLEHLFSAGLQCPLPLRVTKAEASSCSCLSLHQEVPHHPGACFFRLCWYCNKLPHTVAASNTKFFSYSSGGQGSPNHGVAGLCPSWRFQGRGCLSPHLLQPLEAAGLP